MINVREVDDCEEEQGSALRNRDVALPGSIDLGFGDLGVLDSLLDLLGHLLGGLETVDQVLVHENILS